MERRKFIAAVGSVAAGGAATVGTGAFTSVEADRTVDVEVTGDSSAYLALEDVDASENSDYVLTNSGEVAFDFSGSDGDSAGGGNVSGDGFNPNAITRINDLLEVRNQGTQDVNFWVNISQLGSGSSFVEVEASEYPTTDGSFTSSTSDSGNVAYDGGNAGNVTAVTLSPGDSTYLHLVADTSGQSPNSFQGTATFVAEAGGSP